MAQKSEPICKNCGRKEIAHHPVHRYCKSKDGMRWRISKWEVKLCR